MRARSQRDAVLPRRPRGVIAIRSDAVAAGVGNALLIGVGVCGLIVALLVVVVRGGDGSLSSDPVGSVNDVFVGVAWIAAGIACWWRVRGSPTGPLMVSTGFAWWLADLSRLDGAVAWTAGQVLVGVYLAVGAHVLIGYPRGVVAGRLAVATLVAAYVVKVLAQPALLVFRDPRLHGCGACGRNLLLVRDDPAIHTLIDAAVNAGQIVTATAVGYLLVRHFRSASLATRRALGPILVAGAVVAGVAVVVSAIWLASPAGGTAATAGSRVFSLTVGLFPTALLYGLVRARLARGAVAALVVELGRDPSPDRLEAVIGRALRDPSCQLAFSLADREGYVDASGRAVTLPDHDPSRVVTELHHGGTRIAALVCDRASELNPVLLESVATAARLAIENTRLQAALRLQLDEVRTSRLRLVEAGDAARQRLERDLHDGTQQHVVRALIDLDTARAALRATPDTASAALDAVGGDLGDLMDALRSVARGLHPAILTDRGLAGALESVVVRAALPVTVTALPTGRVAAAAETAGYYVCVEALTNAQKHASARAVSIGATVSDNVLRVVVADDGAGGATLEPGGGLAGLRDRVEALGGQLSVTSTAGAGTRVEALIPCG